MCGDYWDLYDCRWHEQHTQNDVTASAAPAERPVPEPRTEGTPLEAPAGEAAAAARAGV